MPVRSGNEAKSLGRQVVPAHREPVAQRRHLALAGTELADLVALRGGQLYPQV